MDSFSNVPKINAAMFDDCPVWAGEYDEGFSAVFNYDPLPQDLGTLYVKVEFVTPGGVCLTGCITTPARHFAAVFVGLQGFYFNARLRPLESEIAGLNRLVPELQGQIFPLRYETTYRFASQSPIAGSFTVPGGS